MASVMGADLDAAVGLVVGDLKAEGVKDLALDLGGSVAQPLRQVGHAAQGLSEALGGLGAGVGGVRTLSSASAVSMSFLSFAMPLAIRSGSMPRSSASIWRGRGTSLQTEELSTLNKQEKGGHALQAA